MRMRLPGSWLVVVVLLSLAACDGDGCHGGPDGPATRFCQQAIARGREMDSSPTLVPSCEQCCIQEVHYKGRMENGLCVCR
jgi:hypothetical protein